MTPKKPLSVNPPAELTGEVARRKWQETVGLYFTLDARIVSVLDIGLLIDYCKTSQQLAEIDDMRDVALTRCQAAAETLERYQNKKDMDLKVLIQYTNAVNWAADEILKIDARADRKRALIHKMRESLYLTPRSRAGVQPAEREEPKPRSKLAEIIDA